MATFFQVDSSADGGNFSIQVAADDMPRTSEALDGEIIPISAVFLWFDFTFCIFSLPLQDQLKPCC